MKSRHSALILIGIMVVIFIIQNLSEGFTELFVLQSSEIYSRPWILLTSVFLHGSLIHLLSNMFALGLFGMILENITGTKKFLIIFLISGIAASFAASFFYSAALGASGAIFGVLGALAAMRPKMTVWTYGVPMPMFVAAAFWLLLDIGGVFYPSSVANIAHIAGLAAGIAFGLKLREKTSAKKEEKPLSKEEIDSWEKEWM